MRILHLDCSMGAAGDMLTAALLELHPEPEKFVERLNALGIPNVTFGAVKSARCGISGTLMHVKIGGVEEASEAFSHEHSHEHHEHFHEENSGRHTHGTHEHHHEHSEHHGGEHAHGEHSGTHHNHTHCKEHTHHEHHSLADIEKIVNELAVPEVVRRDALAVYKLIAEAESEVHGRSVSEIHFHEVGALDAVADITAVCLLLHELRPEKVTASPVCTGFGQVKCAHGILPVPAPATALLLQDVPTYGGQIQGELCTPTGAALLKHFVTAFESQPKMRVEKLGYGLGKKDFAAANCVRAALGETENLGASDEVLELKCNLDDMTAEALAFAAGELLSAGALDVFTSAIGMKKSRQATLLTCLCKPEQREEMLRLIFRHTTTLGIREILCRRSVLSRKTQTLETELGKMHVKCVTGYGVRRAKPEYEDLAKIAQAKNLPLAEVETLVKASAAYRALTQKPELQ